MKKELLLKKYFGYSAFLPGQKELVDHLCLGEDVLGIMPTGAGKSLCYQLPAMVMEGITLIVSPLIALMKDQVRALVDNGIPAAYINSTLSEAQTATAFRNARRGQYKLIYIAPERLDSIGFAALAREMNISMIAVDEAHCVSQWGQNFRPSYLKIKAFVEGLTKRPVMASFTATATRRVREDIVALLGLKSPYIRVTGFDRPNLFFDVKKPADKRTALHDYIQGNEGKSGIVYCTTRKTVEEVCESLCAKGVPAARYHAGLGLAERNANQEDFIFDRKPVMVATNAFGMGIDKSNVSYVIHYNMPRDLESYYQEAGRAGRDGMDADCILLFGKDDILIQQFLIGRSNSSPDIDDETQARLNERDYHRLRQMIEYCDTTECLRRYILRYFGEEAADCGKCGNCLADIAEVDVTKQASAIISCLYDMGNAYGMKPLTDTLLGKKNERMRELKLDRIKTFGKLKGKNADYLRTVIAQMVIRGYIAQTEGKYPVLKPTELGASALLNGEKVVIRLRREDIGAEGGAGRGRKARPVEGGLISDLKALRRRIAREKGVPSFIIFSDATLADMCKKRPRNRTEFLKVSGVGQTKLEQYGDVFLKLLKDAGKGEY
jgi:ATP-dependent DNA helicase RecQ